MNRYNTKPTEYRPVRLEDLRKKNPNKKWWQFWKSKYVGRNFKVKIMTGPKC